MTSASESETAGHGEMTGPGVAYQAGIRAGIRAEDAPGAVRLAGSLRRLITVSTGSTSADDDLRDVAAAIEALTDRLVGGAQPSRFPGGEMSGDLLAIFRNHPMFGPANALSPPLVPEIDGGRVRMRVAYGPQYEGPPKTVHGGHVAAGFDGVLAVTGGVNGAGGLTRSLKVRYRRPAPTGVELVYEGWVESSTDRATFINGVLRHGDTVCAEGEAEFARRPLPLPLPSSLSLSDPAT